MKQIVAALSITIVALVAPSRALADDASPATAAPAPASDAAAPAAASEESPAAPAAAPASREKPAEPTVLLHVDSPRVVAIERVDDGELVCTSPCNARVPATVRYRIAGSRASDGFLLDARRAKVNITVDPASNRSFILGVGALGLGSALAIAGGIVLGAAAASREPIPVDGVATDTSHTDAISAGMVMLLTGLGGAIWGGGTAIANRKTRVTGDVVGPAPVRGLGPAPKTAAVAPPPFISIPILGGTF